MDPFPPHPTLIIRARAATFILIRGTAAPPDLRHFEFASRGTADPVLFAALQSAIHDTSMMSQVRSYFATWEHIDVSRMDDAAIVRILRDEIEWHALAAYHVTDEHFLPVWTSDPGPISPPTGPVATWSTLQKLSAMFQAMPAAAGPVLGAEVSAFFSPENIALMAAFGEAIAAAQTVAGANAVVDALILGVGWAVFGSAGLCAAWDFAKAMIRAGGATSEDEIRLAARLAVAAFVSIGLVLFLHKLSGKLKRDSGAGDDAPPKTDAPPNKGRPRPQRPEDLPNFRSQVTPAQSTSARSAAADVAKPKITEIQRSLGHNSVLFKVDANGNPLSASGNLKEYFAGGVRSAAEVKAQAEAAAAGLAGDHGGHLVGYRFLPEQGSVNLFPQEGNFNMSAFKTIENGYARYIKQGYQVDFSHVLVILIRLREGQAPCR